MRDGFRKFDGTNVQYLDQNKFVGALDAWGLTGHLNDQELMTILRRFQVQLFSRYFLIATCTTFLSVNNNSLSFILSLACFFPVPDSEPAGNLKSSVPLQRALRPLLAYLRGAEELRESR